MSELVHQPGGELPSGFTRGPGGLLVPQGELPIEREVWTQDEAKIIRRAQAIAARRGLRLIVGCEAPCCAENPLVSQVDGPGGAVWTCGHKEREIRR